MDKVKQFEDLEVWKESMRLTVEIYNQLIFCKDFSLRDQIHRSTISVPSNIAEGFERKSNKEFIQFLYIAKGSYSELRTQLYLTSEIAVIDRNIAGDFVERTRKISTMFYNLIKTRKEKFQ